MLSVPTLAQQAPDGQTNYTTMGVVGLLEMPSARMAADGTLLFGASFMKNTQHYVLGFQALPWLEASFRYSGLSHYNPDFPVYWDRSFAIKTRLMEESDVRPALALGIGDIVGTGVYNGEYVVASKNFGSVDATLGIGWGRLSSANSVRNPLALLSGSFDKRTLDVGNGGQFSLKEYFRGHNAGVFGGIAWQTPVDGLKLLAEISSDKYVKEASQGSFIPMSQLNWGFSYQLSDSIGLHMGYLYGNTISGGLTVTTDPPRYQYPERIGEPMPSPEIRTQEAQESALQKMAGRAEFSYAALNLNTKDQHTVVDKLLSNFRIEDVQLRGRVMDVTMAAASNPKALCLSIAGTVQGPALGVTDVIVRDHAGKVAARCPIQSRIQVNARPVDLISINIITDIKDVPPIVIDATSVLPHQDSGTAEIKFRADAKKQGIFIDALSFAGTEASVYYTNSRYQHESDALERLVRLLMQDAPTDIEKFRLIATQSNIAQQEFHFLRAPLERALGENSIDASVFDSPTAILSAPVENPILLSQVQKKLPSFDAGIYPQLRQQLFDPSGPLGLQVVGVVEGSAELAQGLSVWGQGEFNIFNNFITSRKSDSVLPHVRTDFVNYFTEGQNGLGALQLNYRTKLAPEFYATLKAGYLESMFAGVGGEVLYRPDGARWAIGADLYELKQRNFDRLLGLQPYHVATGHLSVYWDSPFWDLNFQARVGQYLAGDRGVTLQISRRFSTGVEVGVFFTKTNVSATRFGEGSFDKGILIRIPTDWMVPINSQSEFGMVLRPVQRDGGQVLAGDATLYDETRRASQSEFVRSGYSFANE